MYIIRQENLEQLKAGRTVKHLANITGFSYTYLNEVFNGHRCLLKEESLMKILEPICSENVELKELLEQGNKHVILYFFKEI